METIYKYELEVIDDQEIIMPEGAIILSLHTQNGSPCLWAKVNPDPEKIEVVRRIKTYGTGHPIHNPTEIFIGTYLIEHDSLVFHVFENLS